MILNKSNAVAAATSSRVFLGPFPPGSFIRSFSFSWSPATTDDMLLAIAGFQGRPGDTEAEFAGGIPFSGSMDGENIAGAPAMRVAEPVAATQLQGARYFLGEYAGDWDYLGFEVLNTPNTGTMIISLEVIPPSSEIDDVALSRPGTAKAPTAAGRIARAPHVVNRSAAPIPVQSQPIQTPGFAPVPFR